jgi:hypothetical protein
MEIKTNKKIDVSLLLPPDYRSNKFIRNVGKLLPEYRTSYSQSSIRQSYRCNILKFNSRRTPQILTNELLCSAVLALLIILPEDGGGPHGAVRAAHPLLSHLVYKLKLHPFNDGHQRMIE